MASRSTRTLVAIMTGLGYSLLYIPILTVVVLSFVVPLAPGSPEVRFGLDWYERLAGNVAIGDALRRSLITAMATAFLASILGTLAAVAIERGNFPGRRLLGLLTMLPLVMPELVLGIASLIWFSILSITLGLHSVIMAHTTFAVSYVTVTVRASLRDFDVTLIDAARDLGAGHVATWRRVVLPVIAPGIAAGALMAFTLSFDDFLISFFTAGAGSDTLPVRLYSMIRFGINREMYALSTLLVATAIVAVVAQRVFLRRKKLVV